MFGLRFNFLKSKTFWGSLIAGVGTAVNGNLSKPSIIQGVGIFLAGTGIRDAIARAAESIVGGNRT
jgi:hypothetical protein